MVIVLLEERLQVPEIVFLRLTNTIEKSFLKEYLSLNLGMGFVLYLEWAIAVVYQTPIKSSSLIFFWKVESNS